MNVRQHIWMIYKELITNVVRHAQATHVKVQLTKKGNELKVSVSDNGIGFDTTAESDGNGLKNIKRRSDKLKATLTLVSSSTDGTSCALMIPFS